MLGSAEGGGGRPGKCAAPWQAAGAAEVVYKDAALWWPREVGRHIPHYYPTLCRREESHSFPELVVIVHESREGKGLINKPEQDAADATRPAAASITPPYVTSREASGAAAAPSWEIFRVTQVDNARLCGANTALSRLFARGSARCQVEGGSLSLRGSKL